MKLLYCFFLSAGLLACSKNGSGGAGSDGVRIKIDVQAPEIATYDRIIDSVRYVKLEATDESLMARVNKIAFLDSLMYLLDTKTNAVFTFTRNGKFKFKIDRQGAGPEEYVTIQDFTLNKHLSTVDILDLAGKKILRYRTTDGEFVETVPFRQEADYFAAGPEGSYLTFGFRNGFFMADKADGAYTPVQPFSSSFPLMYENIGYLYKTKNQEPAFFSPADNSIYHLENGVARKRYVFSYRNSATPADFPGAAFPGIPANLQTNGITLIAHTETPEWIYQGYAILKNQTSGSFLYYKKARKAYYFTHIDYFPGVIFPGAVVQESADDFLVMTSGSIPPDKIIEVAKMYPYQDKCAGFIRLLEGMTENDNPLLQFIYPKKELL